MHFPIKLGIGCIVYCIETGLNLNVYCKNMIREHCMSLNVRHLCFVNNRPFSRVFVCFVCEPVSRVEITEKKKNLFLFSSLLLHSHAVAVSFTRYFSLSSFSSYFSTSQCLDRRFLSIFRCFPTMYFLCMMKSFMKS
jgi:hypothetical protein